MEDRKLFRLVFVGGFGEYFIWSLVLILAFIPLVGAYFQFIFLKWLARNTLLVPIEWKPEDVNTIVKSIVDRERAEGEIRKAMESHNL